VVAIWAGKLLAGEPCAIYGDGGQTRDFVYVDDVVDAFVRAGDKGGGLLLNVGTGVETSVLTLYTTMAEAVGSTQGPEHREARAGELQRSALDVSKAKLHLGWEPWTDLATGCAATLRWFDERRKAAAR
jgi:UDP-glucose 4-epimerase